MGLGRKPHTATGPVIVSFTVVVKFTLGHSWEAQVGPPACLFVNHMTSSQMEVHLPRL